MNALFAKHKTIILFIIFLSAILFSRLVNLGKTARFIWDESSDLVNIHEIYVDKKITLVGPISEDGSKVFGSLTYYMLMPFAIVGNFDPVSTAYGDAFWGIITGVVVFYLVWKINKKLLPLACLAVIFWYPLVETGRWAWNPNLIPLFSALAILISLRKGRFSKLLAGMAIGLTVHLHYLSVYTVAGFTLIILAQSEKGKRIRDFLIYAGGVILTILPFVAFDLLHPPGLFTSRILYFNNMNTQVNLLQDLPRVTGSVFYYFTKSYILEIILLFSVLGLVVSDIKNHNKSIYYFLVFLLQIVGVSFVNNFYTHYIIPGIVFFLIYLFLPRKKIGKAFSYLAIITVISAGVLSFPKLISQTTWEGNINATRYITNVVSKEIVSEKIKNNNIVVLASPDTNIYGRRYRDILLIKNIQLLTKEQYEITDHLFVVSTSPIEVVRTDNAYEMNGFRNGIVSKTWSVPDSPWNIYLLLRDPT